MKILAVDDDPIFLEMFNGVLSKNGLSDTTLVGSGAAALQAIDAAVTPFDCIFVDIQMPEMNGIQLCQKLRGTAEARNAQIVMVTKMSERSSIDDAFLAGADDYITKPLDFLEIRARLRTIKTINEERRRNALLLYRAESVTVSGHTQDFEEPIRLSEVQALLSFPALQNYLSTLGRIEKWSTVCMGFVVENAANIYVRTNDEQFADILADVADTICDILKQHKIVMAYAGQGEFVCVLPSKTVIDPDEIELQINDAISEYQDCYSNGTLPVVRAGEATTNSVFSRKPTNDIVAAALANAQARRTSRAGYFRKVA